MPRNVSGTYTLPLPPVVANTVIQAAWANTTTDDIAQGITDSLDRQGRGGMIAPFRLVDGSIPSPALAFSAETGTGLSRPSAGVLAVSIMGVKVGQFSSTGLSTLVAGLFPDGTLAAPSISFTSDSDTGFYKPGVSNLSVAVDGKRVAYFDTRMVVEANAVASSPSMVVNAGNNAGGAGFAIDILGSGIGTDQAIFRMLNQGYSAVRFQLLADSAGAVLGTPGALPLSFVTNNVSRANIDASGNFRVTGPLVAAPNFWVGETSAGAGTVGISGGLGASTVYWGTTSAGLGGMDFYASGQRQLNINAPAGVTANVWNLTGGVTGNRVAMNAGGSDTNVGIQWATKGQGDYAFFGNGGVSFQILCTTTGARWIQINGASSTTNPTLSTNGGGVNVTVPAYGSGVNVTPANDSQPHTGAYGALFADCLRFQDWTQTADNRTSEMRWGGGFTTLRVLNDLYNAATNWIVAVGGYGTGVSEVGVHLSNAGAAEVAVIRAVRTAASVFNVGIGTLTPGYQLQVAGVGQSTVAIFDQVSSSTVTGATIYLADQGVAGGNGGAIMFGAFTGPTASGKHFASIRGYITDASNNTAGEIRIQTKDDSTATGSTQALRITAAKTLLDNRDLSLVRDPGTTAGVPTTTNLPIGSIIFATVGAGAVPALGSVNAATFNLTIQGTGAAANATVTAGTWRNCGARDVSVGHAMFLRIA
jgi:hypothetical protein